MNLLLICSMLWTIAAKTAESPTVIHWQNERALVWEDFQAEPPEDDLAQAKSYAGLSYYLTDITDHSATITVEAVFDQSQSWVRPEDKVASTLLHEQLHFDITEVCARACRKIIANEEYTKENFQEKLKEIIQDQFDINNEYQAAFDFETSLPRNLANEEQWHIRIHKKLGDLQDYRIVSQVIYF